jgi:acetyl esterase/lipase
MSASVFWNTVSAVDVDRYGRRLIVHAALTPEAPFPTQLRQANAALSFLLSNGVSPSNLVFGGDSAGGNLAMQLASHLLHPLASIPAPPTLSSPLAGALLMSPWTGITDERPSYTSNAERDVIHPAMYRLFARDAAEGITPELRNYVQASTASADWWRGIADAVVPRILITKAECECLLDEITELEMNLKPHVPQLQVLFEEDGVHEDVIMAFAAGVGKSAIGYPTVIQWLKTVFA